jgi:predicted alpha/beta-hydrolase family hydrolase
MTVGGALFFPGAGGGRDTPSLVAVDRALAREEADLLATSAGIAPDTVVLGGRSMGGRMCSMAVAEGLPAAGLALIAYPLHPPGKADRLRVEHFPDITVPCLFVSGTRDPFGTPEELESHTAPIAGEVTHVWIEGGRHELRGADATVAKAVADWASVL